LTTLFAALRADCVIAVADPKLAPEQRREIRALLDPFAVLEGDELSLSPGGPASARPFDLAAAGARFVYFTSGSTGLPKGVVLAEETIAANVLWNTEILALREGDVGGLFLPLSHSFNLVFALCFLLRGAPLVLERDLSDLHETVARMSAARVTVLQQVPTSLRTIVERADLEQSPLSHLRLLRVGAGVLSNELATKTLAAFPGASVVATYGLTEIGLVASRTWTSSPIAESTFDRLVPGCDLRLLDAEHGEGEIEIAHDLLFIGYLEAGPSSGYRFERRTGAHRTGDLGARPRPGLLELRSRKKAVAKVAGVLIHLDEVAKVAANQAGIVDSCAIAVPHPLFGEAVHVFLAAAADARVDAPEVARRVVEGTLLRTSPRVHVLPRLPRSDSGKIARSALEAIALADAPGSWSPGEVKGTMS
jgi:long-chain acyl-CoA synthetase